MADRASEIANLLLREGALRRDDPEHRLVYEELGKDTVLADVVRQRLAGVGFELVDDLGHMGVRPTAESEAAWPLHNRLGFDARHIRIVVYLWTQLVYREIVNLRRNLSTGAPAHLDLFESEDEAPHVSFRAVWNDFASRMPAGHLKGILRALKRQRFIRYDEKRDRIWADAALYVLIDRARMEEFVLDLARRMGGDDPEAVVSTLALGDTARAASEQESEEGDS